LVATEEEAYRYWLGTVSACLTAERAYGPRVIHRLKYSDLIGNPETALRSLLNFLGEPYSEKCLEPLSQRINSSDVPADFRSDDPATDAGLVEQVRRLSRELEQSLQPTEGSTAAVAELEAAFTERVQHMATLESQHQRALQIIQTLEQTRASENAPFCETH
jgi:predicted ATP-dependent protease